MIAAAMGTSEISPPKYVDLARTEADIERTLSLDQCSRLAQLVVTGEPIRARLRFEFGKLDRVGWADERQMRLAGELDWRCTLACQRCPENVMRDLHCQFSAWLVGTEDEAVALSIVERGDQVVVVSGSELDLVELLEDELLLSIPAQVCIDETCINRPPTSFGDLTADTAQDERESPFAILRQLSDSEDNSSR